MIAMQYSFTLPADYDMDIIDQRIRDKGPMLDGYPHLCFKAYLSARASGGRFASRENLYAPFYLWNEPAGMVNFLASPGFAGLTRQFGWPTIMTWAAMHAEFAGDLCTARFAHRETDVIPAHSDLAALRQRLTADAKSALGNGALAAVAAFDPQSWTLVRLTLHAALPSHLGETGQTYDVGHVSLPS